MMDIVMPETCWAFKKDNKISGIYLFFFYSSDTKEKLLKAKTAARFNKNVQIKKSFNT